MNKIYRVIWDRIKHVFIAVSELSNGNKKATYGSNNKKEALKKKTNIGKLSLISLLFLSFAPSYSLASTLLNGANQGTTGWSYDTNGNRRADDPKGTDIDKESRQTIESGADTPQAMAIGKKSITTDAGGMAIGDYSLSKGVGAISLGINAQTNGRISLALGSGAFTSSNAVGALAFGAFSVARGIASTTMGVNSTASGERSIALGYSAYADDNGSIAIGSSSTVKNIGNTVGRNDTVINQDGMTRAQGVSAVALGNGATTNADNALSLGMKATSSAKNAVALGADSVANTENTVSVGSSGNERTIVNVKTGKLDTNSTDAVNGSQLFSTNENVTKNTSSINDNADRIKTNSDKLDTQDKTIAQQGDHINTISTNVDSITQNIDSGALGVVKLSPDKKTILFNDQAKDAEQFVLNNKTLTGVNNATLAKDSTDAVNGSQLFSTNENVTKNTSSINDNADRIKTNSDKLDTQDKTIAQQGDHINTISTNVDSITNNINSGTLGLIQLNSDKTKIVINNEASNAHIFDFSDRKLAGVSDGKVSADSTEAVNGSQLNTTDQNVAKNTQNIQSNTEKLAEHDNNIAQNTKDIQANSEQLAKHDAEITQNMNDIKENTTHLANHDKEIAQNKQDIKTNTDALVKHEASINENTNNIQKNTHQLEKQGNDIKRLNSEVGNGGIVKVSDDGKSIELSEKADNATSFNMAKKRVTGVSEAKEDNDAVNYAQMKRTNTETLKSSQHYTDDKINQLGEYTANGLNHLDNRIDDLDKKVKKGFATNSALSGLFQPYGVGKMNITAGVGGYQDEAAIAVGVGYRVNEKVAIKGGVASSAGNDSSTMYNASVNFEF